LIERFGNVLGPLVAGALIAADGFKAAFYGIGIITLSSSVLFTVAFFVLENSSKVARSTAP
jgi:hypothetical protein